MYIIIFIQWNIIIQRLEKGFNMITDSQIYLALSVALMASILAIRLGTTLYA